MIKPAINSHLGFTDSSGYNKLETESQGGAYEIQSQFARNRRRICDLGSGSSRLLVTSKTEAEAFENIKYAIEAYLKTVEESGKV